MNEIISLLVGFVPQTTNEQKNQLHSKVGARLVSRFDAINVEVVEVLKIVFQNVLNVYQSSHHVAFVEENTTYSISFQPNDPYYEQPKRVLYDGPQSQWGLKRVNPEAAWELARKIDRKVTIAILDTGIDPNHPDLSSKIVKPVNFTTKDRNDFKDENGHGTHVAGIAAAVTNNKRGVAGISYNSAKIMPVKVAGPNGGKAKWLIAGILYAVLNGAKVINISIGGPPFSLAFQRAIDYAWLKGVVIVAAAGNGGKNKVEYPAGYNFVLAVSATNKANDLAEFSNWGMNIGISAPGTSILSTTPTYSTPHKMRSYDALQGTSQATPFVSGLAALLFAIYPDLSNAEVIQLIQRAADPIDEKSKQWNNFYGYGLLNASNAVNRRTGKTIRRTTRRGSSRRSTSGRHTPDKGAKIRKGSFYGQIVDQLGNPIANAIVSARISGKIVSTYKTKTNVHLENNSLGTDGMFRLHNLLPGRFSIFVELPGQPALKWGTSSIIGGADTLLRLVCKT
ncbi:S8 family serine peptidase [Bacillus sp. EB600]|uniref:S8 family serine peptidase n=1 Tax=Bacillus sp. EB600 TaxID=2806345 RepID=UPI00210C2449|nr:S8 family serine peptidase [Bacillus sp. EB600]MCQ6279545.1 S8 family serine peptidase [Bacillus sp. EB600]